jgi:hypothetical protein
LKKPLPILGEADDREPAEPRFVAIGNQVISISDAHVGAQASEVAQQLVKAGAVVVDGAPVPTLRIVVRSTPRSAEARLRAEALEREADVVLGEPRPAFAAALAGRLGS